MVKGFSKKTAEVDCLSWLQVRNFTREDWSVQKTNKTKTNNQRAQSGLWEKCSHRSGGVLYDHDVTKN